MIFPKQIRQVLFFSVLCGTLCSSNKNSSGENDENTPEAVTSLLRIKEMLEHKAPSKKTPLIPQYMLHLHDKYNKGEASNQGNIVRSILSIKGKFEGVDMLVFNLTGIHANEQITQGMLHLNKRKRFGSKKKRTSIHYKLKVLDLKTHSDRQWINLSDQEKHGWLVYNITELVIRCRSTKNQSHYLIGITAEAQKTNGEFKPVFLKQIIRKNSNPFLVIFSEDRNKQGMPQGIIEEIFVKKEWNNIRFNLSLPFNETLNSRSKRSQFSDVTLDYSHFSKLEKLVHQAQFLSSNEVPDETNDTFNSSNLPEDKLPAKFLKKNDSNIIPVPHNLKSKKTYPWRRKNRRKNRKLPFWWIKHRNRNTEGNKEKACQRKKLVIDFSKIGWSKWIIAPNIFNAYYCTGSCSFPEIKNGRPSNHATIQSLVHALGKGTEVPAPCCIPSATSSLTMLYVDENDRVVLKSYPDMTVESCACR